MNKILITALFFCCCSLFVNGQETKRKMAYSGFSGGMMLHLGYVQSSTFTFTNLVSQFSETMRLQGLAFGLGGQAKVHFGKHLRMGTEGYFSKHKYKNGSYVSVGWGGVLADCAWKIKKFTVFTGGTVGGGSQQNLTIFTEQKNDYIIDETTSYRNYGFMCIVPFAGFEFAMSKSIYLVFKTDYMINVSNPQDDFITGPRFYVGFTFFR